MRLIDADALIPMMKYATTDNEIGIFPIKIGFDAIVKVIEEQSTIEPERQKGKWINAQYPFSKCSICECYFDTENNIGNYCPNCGAEMEGQDGRDI